MPHQQNAMKNAMARTVASAVQRANPGQPVNNEAIGIAMVVLEMLQTENAENPQVRPPTFGIDKTPRDWNAQDADAATNVQQATGTPQDNVQQAKNVAQGVIPLPDNHWQNLLQDPSSPSSIGRTYRCQHEGDDPLQTVRARTPAANRRI